MNKKLSLSVLIIISIMMLALKDSASFIHTILHYIPDNPWHQHTHIYKINPMEIHKYLQHEHAHEHHTHSHTHDIMDHFHSDSDQNTENKTTPAEDIKLPVKIDVFFQQNVLLHFQQNVVKENIIHYSFYSFLMYSRFILPPLQPPQV